MFDQAVLLAQDEPIVSHAHTSNFYPLSDYSPINYQKQKSMNITKSFIVSTEELSRTRYKRGKLPGGIAMPRIAPDGSKKRPGAGEAASRMSQTYGGRPPDANNVAS